MISDLSNAARWNVSVYASYGCRKAFNERDGCKISCLNGKMSSSDTRLMSTAGGIMMSGVLTVQITMALLSYACVTQPKKCMAGIWKTLAASSGNSRDWVSRVGKAFWSNWNASTFDDTNTTS